VTRTVAVVAALTALSAGPGRAAPPAPKPARPPGTTTRTSCGSWSGGVRRPRTC